MNSYPRSWRSKERKLIDLGNERLRRLLMVADELLRSPAKPIQAAPKLSLLRRRLTGY